MQEAEDRRVRTKHYALRISKLFVALPKATEAQALGKQALRSGTSVGANYREAFRARSDNEFLAKLGDSLKELEETNHWLELLSEAALFTETKLTPLIAETNEPLAIFTTIAKSRKAVPRKTSSNSLS